MSVRNKKEEIKVLERELKEKERELMKLTRKNDDWRPILTLLGEINSLRRRLGKELI